MLAVLACFVIGDARADDLAEALGEPYYTGRIIPTPQKCRLLSSELTLADANLHQARAAILLDAKSPGAIRFGAEEFADRIARAAELTEFSVREWDGSTAPPGFDAYIAVGLAGDKSLSGLSGYDRAWEGESRPEGYHIRPTRIGAHPALLVAGNDARGAFYGLSLIHI